MVDLRKYTSPMNGSLWVGELCYLPSLKTNAASENKASQKESSLPIAIF